MARLSYDEFISEYKMSPEMKKRVLDSGTPGLFWNECSNPMYLVEILMVIKHPQLGVAKDMFSRFLASPGFAAAEGKAWEQCVAKEHGMPHYKDYVERLGAAAAKYRLDCSNAIRAAIRNPFVDDTPWEGEES